MIPEDPSLADSPSSAVEPAVDGDFAASVPAREEGEMPKDNSQPDRSGLMARSGLSSDWVGELLDILDQRRVQVMRMSLGIVLLGLVIAVVQPESLRPSVPVGILVGLAAVVAAAAAAFALDSADALVRGPRHVRASGGSLLVHGRNAIDTTAALGTALAPELDGTRTLRYGFVEVGSDHALSGAISDEVARLLAADEQRVIATDLVVASAFAGVAEVVLGQSTLADTVQFVGGLTLAQITAGQDLDQARRTFPTFLRNLPPDIDVVVAGLPSVDELPSVDLAGFDRVFVLAVRNVSRRVDLMATLDHLQPTGVDVQVLLIDPRAPSSGPSAPVAGLVTESAPRTGPDDLDSRLGHDDPDVPPTHLLAPATGVGLGPVQIPAARPVEPSPSGLSDDDHTAEIRRSELEPLRAAFGDDLDPDLLAEALATGDLDVVGEDDLGSRVTDLPPDAAPTEPPPAALPPQQAAPVAPPAAPVAPPAAPAAPVAPPAAPVAPSGDPSITRREALGPEFRQVLHGQPEDSSNRTVAEPARAGVLLDDQVAPTLPPATPAAPMAAPVPAPSWTAVAPNDFDDEPIGGADEFDDDPMGMTAALHSFSLERMGDQDDDEL